MYTIQKKTYTLDITIITTEKQNRERYVVY